MTYRGKRPRSGPHIGARGITQIQARSDEGAKSPKSDALVPG